MKKQKKVKISWSPSTPESAGRALGMSKSEVAKIVNKANRLLAGVKVKKQKPKSVYVWTWTIQVGGRTELCRFASATKAVLLQEQKPSPESRPVRVRMGYL